MSSTPSRGTDDNGLQLYDISFLVDLLMLALNVRCVVGICCIPMQLVICVSWRMRRYMSR